MCRQRSFGALGLDATTTLDSASTLIQRAWALRTQPGGSAGETPGRKAPPCGDDTGVLNNSFLLTAPAESPRCLLPCLGDCMFVNGNVFLDPATEVGRISRATPKVPADRCGAELPC